MGRTWKPPEGRLRKLGENFSRCWRRGNYRGLVENLVAALQSLGALTYPAGEQEYYRYISKEGFWGKPFLWNLLVYGTIGGLLVVAL